MQAPNYRILMHADTFDQDTDLPKVVFWRDMMLLGSVLLPEEPAPPEGGDPPAYYLDDPAVRAIIQAELDMPLRQFVRGMHVASWAFQLVLPGAPRGTSAIPRRFYTTSPRLAHLAMTPVAVPWQVGQGRAGQHGRDADATVMPDLRGRYRPDALRRVGVVG